MDKSLGPLWGVGPLDSHDWELGICYFLASVKTWWKCHGENRVQGCPGSVVFFFDHPETSVGI